MLKPIWGTACAVMLLAGCAATQQAREVQTSGFLGADYALLSEGEAGEALLVYSKPGVDWAGYDKIKLDPVTIWTGEGSSFDDFSQPDRQALADNLFSTVHEELAADYEIVDELGPDVLHIQLALTDAQKSNPTMDTISTVVPIGLAVSEITGLVTGKPSFVGEASGEARLLDGASGELLAAAVDRRVGGKALGGDPVNSWDDVGRSFSYWAKQMRYRLCTNRGGADCVPPEA